MALNLDAYYLSIRPDVAAAVKAGAFGGQAINHWIAYGRKEGFEFLPGWSEEVYRAKNPDIDAEIKKGALVTGLQHYIAFGAKEGRAHAGYDEEAYLARNPDVAAAVKAGVFSSGLAHYAAFGQAEGRPTFIATTSGEPFDAIFYLKTYTDVADAIKAGTISSAAQHYVLFGQAENRQATSTDLPGQVKGETFTLTDKVDTFAGTAGNDTIVGTKTTFQAADTIDGGAGTDKLQLTIDGAVTAAYDLPAADVKNVEIISVRNVQTGSGAAAAVNVNGNNFVGATEFVNDRSDQGVAFNNIGKADVTIQGNGVVTHTATNIAVGASAVTDAFVLNIKGGVKGGDVTVSDTNAKWTDATINSTGAANTVGALNLSGTTAASTHTIKTLTINAATNLTTGNITGFDTGATVTNTINVAGAAAKVNIGTAAGAIDVIDASGLTAGGLTVDISAVTGTKFKLTGGAGNDTVTTSSAVALTKAGGAVVDAGAGDADVLAVAAAFVAGTAAHKEAAALYKNFEVLQVNAGVDQDVSLFSGSTIGAIRINAAGAKTATGVSNLSAAQAANITLMGAASGKDILIGVKDATVTGNLDTVKITVDDLNPLNAVGTVKIGAGNLKMAGVENLEITAVDNFTLVDLVKASDVQSLVLKGAGKFDITTGAVNLAINSSIDATAATGTVKIDASKAQAGSAAKGLAIKGSLANTNDIKDSAKADVITGGDKADLVTFTGGKDVVTLGKGADVFDFNGKGGTDNEVIFKFVAGDSVGKAGATTIADLLTGNTVDQIKGIKSDKAAASSAGQKFTIDTDVSATAVKSANSIVFGTTTVDNAGDFFVLIGATGVDNTTAYVFQDSNGNGKIDASDFAIELVGVANGFTAGEFTVAGGNLVYTSAA